MAGKRGAARGLARGREPPHAFQAGLRPGPYPLVLLDPDVNLIRLFNNLIGDVIDALFVYAHLDAENQLSHCPKAVEAVSVPFSSLRDRLWSLLTNPLRARSLARPSLKATSSSRFRFDRFFS